MLLIVVCAFAHPLIELYQGGPGCGLDLKHNMTQKPHEAHRAQPVTTEEETYINQTGAMVQEQAGAHKQVEVDKQFMCVKKYQMRNQTIKNQTQLYQLGLQL